MKKMFKKLSYITLVIISIVMLASCSLFPNYNDLGNSPELFQSKQDYINFCKKQAKADKSSWFEFFTNPFNSSKDLAVNEGAEAPTTSKTNVQVEGVDEGDIVKVDGQYIYQLTGRGFIVSKVENGQIDKLSQIMMDDYVPIALYVNGNQLIMIGTVYSNIYINNMVGSELIYDYYNVKTNIAIYNLANKTQPILEREIAIDGSYSTSRIIDNQLVYVLNYYDINLDYYDMPTVIDSVNQKQPDDFDITKLYHFKTVPYRNCVIIGSINLDQPTQDNKTAYLGLSGQVYVSSQYLYLATNLYGNWNRNYEPSTHIIKVSLDNLTCVATTTVKGTINDRYSMDEYEEYFRIATTSSDGSNLYVLDSQLKKIGSIEKIAPGEQIYSVRFNGTTASIVTFLQIDPLFKVDLTDPRNPTISKGLKENGVSHYLQYIEGTNYVIGLGHDGDDNGSLHGLKVSLYDYSGGEHINIGTIALGDYGYAEAIYNPIAIYYDREYNLFGFSANIYSYLDNGESYYGFFIFSFVNGELKLEMVISKIDYSYGCDWNEYYNLQFEKVNRVVRVGEYVYAISEKYISSYDIKTWELVERLQVSEVPTYEEKFN